METETYKILGWYVTKAQGPIPQDGFTTNEYLTIGSPLGAHNFSWHDGACSMSVPSVQSPASVQVHFVDRDVVCLVELKRYGTLLFGALTCGLGVPSDGNAGIFVAEAILPGEPVDSV